jgi:Trp operon repressor
MVKLSNSNKLTAVLRYLEGNESYRDIATELGIDLGQISRGANG